VPPSARICCWKRPGPDHHAAGLRPAAQGLQREAHGIAWYFSLVASVYDGAARAARDWLAEFLNHRRPSALGGASLASLPTVQEKFGEIEVLLQASDCLLDSHARAYDAGSAPTGWRPWPSMSLWITPCEPPRWLWSWPATTVWHVAIRSSAICAMCFAARSIHRPTT
jgi:alkylation response protein AidB-like acyl-CoA dehydrogenase